MTYAIELNSFNKLRNELGDSFVIFCGCGISLLGNGIEKNFLPSVSDFSKHFFYNLKLFLELEDAEKSPSYYDRLLAKYSYELAEGVYVSLRINTKFEDLLYRIQVSFISKDVGSPDSSINAFEQPSKEKPSVIDSLIRAVFKCKEKQFNSNHSAISFLLEKKKASAVITTNFDNAIELCNNSIRLLIHSQPLNNLENEPYILKLHGDVFQGKIKATSPALIKGKYLEEYNYIEKLLNNKVVLVVGYSGYGDIDISPHLRNLNNTCAKLIWVVKKGERPPDFTKYWIRTNLTSEDTKDNWLLKLGAEYGWKRSTNSQNPEWEKNFKDWFSEISLENLRNSTYIMFDKGPGVIAGWPSLHIQYIRELSYNSSKNTITKLTPLLYWDIANALLSVSAYCSAMQYLEKINVNDNLNNESSKITCLKGFTYWRLGKLDDAIKTLEPIVLDPPLLLDRRELAIITRLYLEIARDIIRSNTPHCKRLKKEHVIEKQTNFEKIFSDFSRLSSESAEYDSFEDGFLSEIIILDIERLQGKKIAVNKIQEVYKQACYCQSWNAADAAARVLISVDFFSGIKALINTNRTYIRQRHYKRIRKGIAAFFYKCFKRPYILDLLDGSADAKLGVCIRELRCKRKLRQWEHFYKEKKIICAADGFVKTIYCCFVDALLCLIKKIKKYLNHE